MPQVKCTLLVVDDEPAILASLSRLLQPEFEVYTAESGVQAMKVFTDREIALILCDQRMPRMSGVQLLEWVRETSPKTVRLLMSGYTDWEDVVDAINRGHVYRHMSKPWRTEELLFTLRDAAKVYWLQESHEQLTQQLRQANEDLEERVQEKTRQLEEKTKELEETNRELQQKNSMLERLALTDELTGLPNRRAIEQILHSEIRRRSRYPQSLAVGLIDADNFKDINTRYLYPGGDQALIALSKVLSGSLREVDSVGRVGGEEFLVIAPETTLEGARVLSERIRQAVEQNVVNYQGQDIRVTVSVGFAVADSHRALQPQELVHRAAAALGDAKKQGRNCSVVSTMTPADAAAAVAAS